MSSALSGISHVQKATANRLTVSNHRTKASQKNGAKGKTKILRQCQDDAVTEVGGFIGKEDRNHGRVHDIEAVVEHSNDLRQR